MPIVQQVRAIGQLLTRRRQTVTTVESCTGGGVAHALTAAPGSSNWFNQGVVTYSNQAKYDLAGVPPAAIAAGGAVSEEVARLMAQGGRRAARADYAVAVTGIAGPGGGSAHKPVGTVCLGWAGPGGWVETRTCLFTGDRAAIREAAVAGAVDGLLARLRE